MDLVNSIKAAIQEGQFTPSRHARERLQQRRIELWQVEAGVEGWTVVEERPDDLPNPSIICDQTLPDGASVIVVWAWNVDEKQALLVTVYFPD